MRKFTKKALAGALSLAMVLGMTAVASPETASAKKVKVKKVTVTAPSGKTAYVAKGKKVNLTATVNVTPNKTANKKVTYKSANKAVATVNSKGQVKGVKVGSTKITVTSKKNSKKKASIKVVVKKAAVKKVKLNNTKLTVSVGSKKTLKATVTPKKNTSSKIAWSSNKTKIATVSSKGVVRGKAEGVARITARAADGSGKKATCTVTVGASISNVMVPHSQIVQVSLTSAKALTASDFTVQSKSVEGRAYANNLDIQKVRTVDGGKTYDVILQYEKSISEDTYVKVTINALKGENSKEIFVDSIADYGYETDAISRVKGTQGSTYSDSWYIDSRDNVGRMKYSVTGLPAGLKAYISKDQTSVDIRGVFNNVEDGTTATLTGVDEKGTTFKKSYVFYVGNKKSLVGNVLSRTVLSYVADNVDTDIDEESGYKFVGSDIVGSWASISGGSGQYEYSVTGLPAAVDTMSVEGTVSWVDGRKDIPAGTYNAVLTVTDKDDATLTKAFPFTVTVTSGVTVTGTVRDASGNPVKDGFNVFGATKMDAYGFKNYFGATTRADGTYVDRIIPGDYYTAADHYTRFNWYDMSVKNMFTAASSVKDFSLPLYLVQFTTSIAGATAYSTEYQPSFYDALGNSNYMLTDTNNYTLYAYLEAGTYDMRAATGSIDPAIDTYYNNTIYAYSKVTTNPNGTYLSRSDRIGEGSWQVSCPAFTVAGAMTVNLTATPVPER